MIITFYGVPGSTAAAGTLTVKYGGNTSCMHIELETGHDLILDAQYTVDDRPHKHGWGQRLISQLRRLSTGAEVGTLAMFHHETERSDSELDEIRIENERYLKSYPAPARSVCAAEGMFISLSKPIPGDDTRIQIEP